MVDDEITAEDLARDSHEGWRVAIQAIRYRKIRSGEVAPLDSEELRQAWLDWARYC
ncbi:MAG: hypothetical protein VW338_00180 [Rhodospirillaceae bacterium]